MKHGKQFLQAILLTLLVLTVGCKAHTGKLEVDQPNLTIDPSADSGTINIRNTGDGELTWSVATDVAWITFSQDEGTGEAVVDASIDRGALPPLSVSHATITITSSGGARTIPVTVPSPMVALDPAYFPLAQGNIWRFGLSGLGFKEAGSNVLASMLKPGAKDDAVMTWEVVNQSTINSVLVWELQVSLPNVNIPIPLGLTVDNALEVSTYWVNVDGGWYITLDKDKLDSLPNTDSLISFVDLVKFPGKLMYLIYSDSLTTLSDAIQVIVNDAETSASVYESEVGAFVATLMVDNNQDGYADTFDPTPLYPLLNAFGAAFDEPSSENPLLAHIIELVADVASGVEPVYAFVTNVKPIIEQAGVDLGNLTQPAPEALQESLLTWAEAFGDEFKLYTNPDPLLQSVVRTLAVGTTNVRVFMNQGQTEEDQVALTSFYGALSSFVFPGKEENVIKAAEALKALELKTILETAIGSYIGLEPADVDEAIGFIEDYVSDNEVVNLHRNALIAVLTQAKEVVTVLQTYALDDFQLADLKTFSADLAAFAEQYATNHSADYVAQAAKIIANAFDDVVDELMIIQPDIHEIGGDIAQLLEDLDNPTEAMLDPLTYKSMLGDLATFFENYADASQLSDAALADFVAVYLRAAESVAQLLVDLKAELGNVEYAEAQGSLESLLFDWPYQLTLSSFGAGVGNPADCLAAQVTIPEPIIAPPKDGETDHVVSMTIWAHDLGPVMYGPLTLQSAMLGGVEHRR